MSFDVPDDRRYLESHEWALETDGVVRVGISDFAQDELGDVVFVELPDEGDDLAQEAEFGVVESIKAVSDLYAPVGGEVVAINDDLFDAPELVNEDPFGEGWMLEIEPDDPDALEALLTADEYEAQIA
ncbi:glycine cleavage system protein GcvH [Natrinema thermotolerans]|uniref:Probable glycine cleavage system H protein n=1 Tax=Natrinema thermotolerans TaxID=121872 RepID=A0AAF0P990_9EURY|nr:glycine cleavage system protein GcvH [Natrinema thermotolerans]ELZ09675.1 glycine cleavage system protein H [Natrinema thermotolerans DSM 11552]QCC60304.1 glycine cleavage system protein GcvH [Natrinema thermotolerans]QCC61213.1 glycine cleavage system protein GcvH [Natrinema thermotolerans]WMT07327.1 glycine cleavage system protein GcvH [Natrinema thermotolerans]